MSRFKKYLIDLPKNEDQKRTIKNTGSLEILFEDSILLKYSLIIGKIIFFPKPIGRLIIYLTRLVFKKAGGYSFYLNKQKEEVIAFSLWGMFFAFFLLSFVMIQRNFFYFIIIILFGFLTTYQNYLTLRNYLSKESFKDVEFYSMEIFTFINWIILLITAGMNLLSSLEYYLSQEKGRLKDYINQEVLRIRAGEVSIDIALRNLSLNTNNRDIQDIFTIILQSQKLGIPINERLETHLIRYQDQLLSNAEKKGANANQKATLFLILELFLIMIFFIYGTLSMVSTGGLF